MIKFILVFLICSFKECDNFLVVWRIIINILKMLSLIYYAQFNSIKSNLSRIIRRARNCTTYNTEDIYIIKKKIRRVSVIIMRSWLYYCDAGIVVKVIPFAYPSNLFIGEQIYSYVAEKTFTFWRLKFILCSFQCEFLTNFSA